MNNKMIKKKLNFWIKKDKNTNFNISRIKAKYSLINLILCLSLEVVKYEKNTR
jgi:hypothetical protein